MNYLSIVVPFAGGLGMFIYGMQIMAQGLENAAGNRMKSLLEALTKNKFMGICLGALITAVIQSSSATTVMVVGFVNAGIMNLTQAMGVIMGANIGTTVTGWLVSSVEWAKALKPSTMAPVALAIGVVIMLTGKRRATKEISSIIIGFGLLFIGISTMGMAVEPLKELESFREIFLTLGNNPLLGILAGALVTAIIQSSSASIGILQSLAVTGLVPFSAAIYIIMGQNIGTCITTILASLGAKKTAKTAALMHLLFNIIGTVIFSVAVILYFHFIPTKLNQLPISQTQISLVHTIFNLATTLLLFPVSNWIVKLAKKIGRVEEGKMDESVVLLDDRMLETPSFALQSTVNEILRMGKIVEESLSVVETVLFEPTEKKIQFLREEENTVDKLSAGITEYAIKLNALQMSEKEHQQVSRLLQVVSDVERISDYCENISESADAMVEKKLNFSEIGSEQLREMMDICISSYHYAMEAFRNNDKEKALRVIEKETQADGLEIQLRSQHMKRLSQNQCDPQAGVIFLDTLVGLERISDHARNIAEEVLDSAN